MAAELSVVALDVDFEILQPVLEEEVGRCLHVPIVLVSRRLLRLGLDEKRAIKADLLAVGRSGLHERRQLLELLRDVGVEERGVPFPTAPEHKVLPSKGLGGVHRGFALGGGVGKDAGVRTGGRPLAVPFVLEPARER